MKKLTLIDKAFWLKKHPLFAGLELDLLLPIADKMTTQAIKEKAPIFWAEEEGFRLYFIVEGAVKIANKQGAKAILGPGDFFGDEAIFSDTPHAYNAISHPTAVLLSLSRTHLFTIIHECPSIAVALLQAYASSTRCRLA